MKPIPLPRVLVVDDDAAIARAVCEGLAAHEYAPVAASSGREALALLGREDFDAVVTSLRLRDADGLHVLGASRERRTDRPVIVTTAPGSVATAIESLRRGACCYLTRPFETEELVIVLGRALEALRLRREAASLRSTLRELQHAVERLGGLGRGVEAQAADLPPLVGAPSRDGDMAFHGEVIPVRDLNRRYAAWALERLGGHKGRTAEALGIDGKTLAKWLSEGEPPT